MTLKSDCNNLKKEITLRNIAIGICSTVFPILVLYGWDFWIKAIAPLIDKYGNPKTPEEALLYLCIVAGFITPVFFVFPALRLGYWLSKILGLEKNRKTRWVFFDDVSYYIKDMPEEQRERIKEILSEYRSKEQLRKDSKRNQSWFRRNFT